MSQASLVFHGSDYEPGRDKGRLATQIERIRRLMVDGVGRTVSEIAAITGDPENSVSAQLRNLRHEENGNWDVRKRLRQAPALYEYFIAGKRSPPPAFSGTPAPVVVETASFPAPVMMASHRYTTSSRRPGQVIHGAVMREVTRLQECAKCHKPWFGGSVHAPHYRGSSLVDCVGDEVRT